MLRWISFAALLSAMAPVSAAQDMSRAAVLAEGVSAVAGHSYAECNTALEKQKALYSTIRKNSLLTFPGFDLVAEGIRLQCETFRLKGEAERLLGERQRLLSEADRLDRLWNDATHERPGAFKDYAGRDHSQKQLRKDAEIVKDTAQVLARASGTLEAEAKRIILLASKNVDLLAEADAKKIQTALDAESQNDILSRLLGTRPSTDQNKS